MNMPSEDHDWMRWVDGEMTPTERAAFEKRLEAEPELRRQVEMAEAMSEALQRELPAEREVPHADFFNSQIQVRIAQEDAERQRAEGRARSAVAGGWSWVKQPWTWGAAAMLVAAALLLQKESGRGPEVASGTWVGASYAPNPAVHATTFHSDEAEATVLMLEGLEEIPADRKVAGVRVGRTVVDAAVATASFLSDGGEVLLVMTRDARQQPHLWAPREMRR